LFWSTYEACFRQAGTRDAPDLLGQAVPEVVQDLELGPRRVIAYADIGSGRVKWLRNWNKTSNLILASDHHDTTDVGDPNLHNVNPELDGFSGESDVCSSTITYLFAKTVDPSSTSSASLAIIGSTEIPGEPRGLNMIPLEDGERVGVVHRTERGGIKLELHRTSLSTSRASTVLNVLGSRRLLPTRTGNRDQSLSQRLRQRNPQSSRLPRRRAKNRQPENAQHNPRKGIIPDEKCPMVSRRRQVQRNERQGAWKLLFLSELPKTRQSCEISDRHDECPPRHSRLGKTSIAAHQGVRAKL
jgi:hypothetical protein